MLKDLLGRGITRGMFVYRRRILSRSVQNDSYRRRTGTVLSHSIFAKQIDDILRVVDRLHCGMEL